MKATRKSIVFMYHRKYRHGGGTVMRGLQLSNIIKDELKDYRVLFRPISKRHKNSILFLTKMATACITIDDLDFLCKKGNKLIFDANDGRISDDKIKYASAIVTSSSVGRDEYKLRYPTKNIFLIDHHVDPRIEIRHGIHETMNIGYFGEPGNTIITKEIAKLVDCHKVDTSSQKNMDWLQAIANYSMHYAIRRRQEFDDFKPATKIFTAAYCNANIIIQETEKEALLWLGEDYPYILRGDVTEDSIIEVINKAQRTFGKKEWLRGLETMKHIRERLTSDHIIMQFKELLASI